MKRLPLGIQTFSKMILDNNYYVDKTEYVSKLANIGSFFFLSRPRRFGKSSFLDTLLEAYEGNESLFKGLYLEKNWDWTKKYPVIKISFGGGQTRTLDDFLLSIEDFFLALQRQFHVQLESKTLAGKFRELIETLHKKTGNQVVILIDEYDKPILDVVDNEELAISVRDELKNLYSVIKDSDKNIQFVFITGVSKFSRVNLFSGLNNLSDITLDPRFATICGYTQKELEHTFQDILLNVPLDSLREWYNGYNFLGEKVYNPYDVLNYLGTKEFKNYWFETGTPSFLIKLIQERKFSIPLLETVEMTEAMFNSFDVKSIQLETLLFQTGYLTIRDVSYRGITKVYHLGYPNLEVKHSLSDSILSYLSNLVSPKEANKGKLYILLEQGNVKEMQELFFAFFASIPYHWYTNNDIANYEGYYCSIFYTYFTAIGVEVKVEDATNHGRIDMVAILNGRCYVIEFKVKELSSGNKAIEQLKERKYHEKYVGYKSNYLGSGNVREIYIIGVELNKADRNITEFEWERIL